MPPDARHDAARQFFFYTLRLSFFTFIFEYFHADVSRRSFDAMPPLSRVAACPPLPRCCRRRAPAAQRTYKSALR